MLNKIIQLFKDHPIEFLSLVIATISALFSFISYRISRKALNISKKDFESKQTNFGLYLIDSFCWRGKDKTKDRYLFFNVSIANKSQSKFSYKGFLEIEYIKADKGKGKIRLEHNPEFIQVIPKMTLSVFPIDIRIEERSTESKWLIFKEPIELITENKIEKFVLNIADINNNVQPIEIYLIKEIQNAIKNN
jgi:hypothetical protein